MWSVRWGRRAHATHGRDAKLAAPLFLHLELAARARRSTRQLSRPLIDDLFGSLIEIGSSRAALIELSLAQHSQRPEPRVDWPRAHLSPGRLAGGPPCVSRSSLSRRSLTLIGVLA